MLLVRCCPPCLQLAQLLSAAKGEELWAAALDDAAADASQKLLLAVGTEVTLVAYTPG